MRDELFLVSVIVFFVVESFTIARMLEFSALRAFLFASAPLFWTTKVTEVSARAPRLHCAFKSCHFSKYLDIGLSKLVAPDTLNLNEAVTSC